MAAIVSSLDSVVRDLRWSCRTLARRPAFALLAILTLALGIGATATIWSVVQAVWLSALPFPEAGRLVVLEGQSLDEGGAVETIPNSYRDFLDWVQASRSFAGLEVYSEALSFNLWTGGQPEHVKGELVSSGYFPLLGAASAPGRTLGADDDLPGAPPVVVVSHDLATRQAPRGRSILGSTLRLNGRPYEVVGVMPAGFRGATDGADLWLPISATPNVLSPGYVQRRGVRWLNVLGRLAPGVSARAADQEMRTLAAELARQFPRSNEGVGVRVVPVLDAWFGKLRAGVVLLLAGALGVLLLASVNVAGLLLARAAARQREISLRTALGAHRGALIRQLLTEGVVLALAAAAVGLIFAHWGSRLLVQEGGVDLKSFVRPGVSLPVIAAVVGLALVTSLLFGLAPAWLGSKSELRGALEEGGRGTAGKSRRRFLAGVVIAEVALGLILLVGAGLLVRGFRELQRTDLGFRADGLLSLRLALKGDPYGDPAVVRRLARQLSASLAGLPGVRQAALVSPDVPTDDWNAIEFYFENRGDAPPERPSYLIVHSLTPGGLATLGAPIVRGRDFTADDDEQKGGVVILSRAAAARFWPGQEPLGKRLRTADEGSPWRTVVGVVADVRYSGLSAEPPTAPDAYFPLFQNPPHSLTTLNLLLRPGKVGQAAVLADLRRQVKGLAAGLPLHDVATISERLARQTVRDRFLAAVLGLFATLALTLAMVGIYGAVSYTAAERRGEIGIRMALGAARRDIFLRMLGRGALLAAAGLALGIPAALALAPLLGGFLHGVATWDLVTLLAASALLFAVVLLANGIPSWRASRVAPAETLRVER